MENKFNKKEQYFINAMVMADIDWYERVFTKIGLPQDVKKYIKLKEAIQDIIYSRKPVNTISLEDIELISLMLQNDAQWITEFKKLLPKYSIISILLRIFARNKYHNLLMDFTAYLKGDKNER